LRDLIEKLLVIPGNLRLTVQEALKHPFFKEAPNFNFESNQKL
jgi:serine/threonine protein kinase